MFKKQSEASRDVYAAQYDIYEAIQEIHIAQQNVYETWRGVYTALNDIYAGFSRSTWQYLKILEPHYSKSLASLA